MGEGIRWHLTHGPVVGTQFAGLDRTIGGPMQSRSEVSRADMHTVCVVFRKRTVDAARMHTYYFGQLDHSETGRNGDSPHMLNTHSFGEDVKPNMMAAHRLGDVASTATFTQTLGMANKKKPRELDTWPQRVRFMELVDQAVERGSSLQEIADALGLPSASSLRTSYRWDHARKPKRAVIEKATVYFGVPLSDLWGEPQPEKTTPAKRLAVTSITRAIMDPRVSDEVAEKIYSEIDRLISEGIIPRP